MFSEPYPPTIKNTTMKQYILLKDLPDAKAGAILDWEDRVKAYKLQKQCGVPPNMYNWYTEADVTQSPEWFKKVEETKWNDELVCEACLYVGMNINPNEDIKKQITALLAKYKSKCPPEWVMPVEEKEYTEKDMRECFNHSKYLLRKYFHERTVNPHIKEPEFEDFLNIMPNLHFKI